VRNKRVYVIPDGVFYWDSSSEGVLLLEYMSQKLYPELFKDLDMKQEVKTYYAKFYHYKLTDDEVNKLLQGLGPSGRRENLLNN
jgi:iron complex transport system substrate-binding protein